MIGDLLPRAISADDRCDSHIEDGSWPSRVSSGECRPELSRALVPNRGTPGNNKVASTTLAQAVPLLNMIDQLTLQIGL